MDFGSFQQLTDWVIANGYWLLFGAILIEGPVASAAGAFAAALGYMNIYTVSVLAVLGNFIPDILLFLIGFYGKKQLAEKYGRRVGLTEERMKYLVRLFENHTGKALMIAKLLPVVPTPGLILAGASGMSLKKYVLWNIIITIPLSLFFVIVGYYFGEAYETINRYVNYGEYALLGLLAIFGIVLWFYKKLTKKVTEEIERE